MKKFLAASLCAVALAGCAGYQDIVAKDLATRTEVELCNVYTMPGSINRGQIQAELKARNVFTADEWQAIEKRQVVIGMRETAARCSWGSPLRVNRTITASGRSAQWVYGYGSYVYIRNGVVEAMQSRN